MSDSIIILTPSAQVRMQQALYMGMKLKNISISMLF